MKNKKFYIVALMLVMGAVLFGCASYSRAAIKKVDTAALDRTDIVASDKADTVTMDKPDGTTAEYEQPEEEEPEEEELQFTATKKKIKCGKSFKFETNRDDVTWSVSNKSKAAISKNGKLKAKRYGKVTVTATSGDESISYEVKLLPKKIIGIDPGHQIRGNNGTEPIGPGSSTKKTKVAGGTSGVATKKPEYQLTLEIGLALKKELINRGYKVVMTRDKNEVDITNIERAQKLNKKCDVAIRLHADAAGSSATGASMLYPSASNPYVGKLSAKSKKLSNKILNKYCKSTGIRKRGLMLRDDLTGTNWSTIPVTLIEMGFMTNSSEDRFMASKAGQKKMVKGIADGIDAYFGY